MAFAAGCRSCLLARLYFSPVALNAKLIHDLFFSQSPLVFQLQDTAFFLGEELMADLAILYCILVAIMGKRHNAALACINGNVLGALVFQGLYAGCVKNDQQKGQDPFVWSHSSLLLE
jgi:hypothetical protein